MINSGINNLNTWFKSNKLSLNLNKTNYMIFGTQNKTKLLNDQLKISINNTEIPLHNGAKIRFMNMPIPAEPKELEESKKKESIY